MRHRKNILFGLVVGSLLCAGIATTTLDAKANTSVDSVSFTMNESGELRTAATGLRFTASMPAADYSDLKGTYDTVSFGVVIMPVAYETLHGEITVKNVFGENAEYYWKTDNGYSVADTSKKHEIIHLESKAVVEDDVVTVKGSIGEIKPAHYDYDFIGVAYVVGEKDGQVPEYRFADFEATSAVNFVEEAQKDTSGHPAAAKVVTDYIKNYTQVNGVAPKANYTVETYVNDVLTDTQVLEGDLNAVVEVDANADLVLDQDKSTLSGKVMYDGSLVLKAYYNKATIQSEETYVLETSRGEVEFDATAFNGTVEKLTYAGKTFNAVDGKWVPANDDVIIPTTQLGEGKTATVETSTAFYEVEVDIYTMIIRDKTDLNAFGAVAKAQNAGTYTWDGYFVLGAPIDYNDTWTPFITNFTNDANNWNWWGFIGTFDGKGHNIDNMTMYNVNDTVGAGGFISSIVDTGIVKNVSFTNAKTSAYGGFISSVGNGTIENVYVHCTYQRSYLGGFFFVNNQNGKATVRNCFVETTPLKNDAPNPTQPAGGANVNYENVYVVGSTNKVVGAGHAFATFEAFLAANVDVSGWDTKFWNVSGGTPYPAKLADKVEIGATLSSERVVPGGTLTINGLTKYDRVAVSPAIDGVTLSGNTISVASTVAADTVISVVVSSVRNATKTATLTVPVIAMQNETVTLDVRQEVEYNVENRIDLAAYDVEGTVTAASLAHGETLVGSDNRVATTAKTSTISGLTMDGNALVLPTTAFAVSQYGEATLTLTVESDDTLYAVEIPLLIITRKISNEEEMNSWYPLAEQAAHTSNQAAGYFVLDDDIDYDGVTFNSPKSKEDMTSGWSTILSTFVFDGRGHKIDNLTIVEGQGAIFGAGVRGTVKNIIFTNAAIAADSSFIMTFAKNTGRLENLYVQLTSIDWGENPVATKNGIFSGGSDYAAYRRVYNCVAIFDDTALKGDAKWFGLGTASPQPGYVDNVFGIGIKNADPGYKNASSTEYTHFDDADAFAAAEVVSEENGWDMSFWTTATDGTPIPVALANN